MKRYILAIVSLLILGIGISSEWDLLAGDTLLPDIAPAQAPQVQEAEPTGLVVSGFISAEEIIVSTEMAGQVRVLYAAEGDWVSAGQVLAELDTTLLDAQIQKAEIAVRGAETQLAAVKAGARPEEIRIAAAAVTLAQEGVASAEKTVAVAQANVASAEAILEAARAELARVRARPDPHELALAEAQLDMAQQRLPYLRAMRDSTGGSEQRGEVPRGSYEAAKAIVAQAELQAVIRQLQLQQLKTGPRPQEVQAAQAAVEAAQAGVDAARAQVTQAEQQLAAAQARLRKAQAQLALVKAGATEEEIAIAEAQVRKAQAVLEILELQRKRATVYAPRDGLVVERNVQVGERALPGSVLFRLADLSQVRLTVYVPESRLGQLYIGQPVAVSVDSFPDQTFPGTVIHIASQAEFTPRNIQEPEERVTQVFAVTIEVPNPNHALKPGMPADAAFLER